MKVFIIMQRWRSSSDNHISQQIFRVFKEQRNFVDFVVENKDEFEAERIKSNYYSISTHYIDFKSKKLYWTSKINNLGYSEYHSIYTNKVEAKKVVKEMSKNAPNRNITLERTPFWEDEIDK